MERGEKIAERRVFREMPEQAQVSGYNGGGESVN